MNAGSSPAPFPVTIPLHFVESEEIMAKAKDAHWEETAVKHPGYLHQALGVPANKPIPAGKEEAATHSKNKHLAEAANLAETFKHQHGNPHK